MGGALAPRARGPGERRPGRRRRTPFVVRRVGGGRGGLARLRAIETLFDHGIDPTAARRYLADPRNGFWIAYRGPRAVGFLRGTALLQLHTRRRQFFLYELEVVPEARRRGVGRAMVRAMLAFARRRGDEEAFAFTSPRNRPAVGLYRTTGGVTETAADRMYVYRLRPPPGPPRRPRTRRRASL